MATRRFSRTSSRGPSKSLETKRHAARTYKRVVRQWWLSLNVKCQILESQPGDACPNAGVIYIIAPGLLQGATSAGLGANFADAMSIRRIEGNLYFRPHGSAVVPPTPSDCFGLVADMAAADVYMRMGLKKLDGAQSNGGVSPGFNPLNNGASPFELSDYVDGRWMKLWEHLWGARGGVTSTLSNGFSCCTERAAYPVPAVVEGNQLGYTVPAAVCVPCGDVEDPAVNQGCQFSADAPNWWHVPIRFGRRIVLKEADSLALFFGWERLQQVNAVDRAPQPAMEWFGGIRLLLES